MSRVLTISPSIPLAVVGDQAGVVGRKLLSEHSLHGKRQGPEDFALLDRNHPLEGVDIVGMDREQPNIFIHALVHAPVEPGERRQVFPDFDLLLSGLLKQALCNDELHVSAGDEDLFEPVFHTTDAVGDEGKAWAVEDGFLHTGDESEPEVLANLADLSQEIEVEDQLLVLTRT